MSVRLPDVARTGVPDAVSPLEWVGMQGLDLPVQLDLAAGPQWAAAKVDVEVNLPLPDVKGIHMSRLHRLLNEFADTGRFQPLAMRGLLARLVRSHEDCGATQARVAWRFDLLRRRPALVSEGLSGWQAYPAWVRAEGGLEEGQLRMGVDVLYSSTCPCSAALARQLVQQAFRHHAGGQETMAVEEVVRWLGQHGSHATPHSQRSVARIEAVLGATGGFAFDALIERVEGALGTAVQTAVKRADEQAFARRNGQNLMYVEDAARRIVRALRGMPDLVSAAVTVRHQESLHPHDVVASAAWTQAG